MWTGGDVIYYQEETIRVGLMKYDTISLGVLHWSSQGAGLTLNPGGILNWSFPKLGVPFLGGSL